jgi:hypothetical protein
LIESQQKICHQLLGSRAVLCGDCRASLANAVRGAVVKPGLIAPIAEVVAETSIRERAANQAALGGPFPPPTFLPICGQPGTHREVKRAVQLLEARVSVEPAAGFTIELHDGDWARLRPARLAAQKIEAPAHPRGETSRDRGMVNSDGGLWRTGAAVANHRTVSQWWAWLA